MSTHNIAFYEEMAKIIFPLSSNTQFFYSSVFCSTIPAGMGSTNSSLGERPTLDRKVVGLILTRGLVLCP